MIQNVVLVLKEDFQGRSRSGIETFREVEAGRALGQRHYVGKGPVLDVQIPQETCKESSRLPGRRDWLTRRRAGTRTIWEALQESEVSGTNIGGQDSHHGAAAWPDSSQRLPIIPWPLIAQQ